MVVLPDNPACYEGNDVNQLATGATGDENIIESFLGSLGSRTPPISDFGGLDSLIGAVALGVVAGLVISLVSGLSNSGNAPVVALVLLALSLITKPDGVFGHHKARAV